MIWILVFPRQKITQHWDKTTRVDNMKVRLVDTNDIIKEKKRLAKKLQELLKRKPLKLITMFFKSCLSASCYFA